ncbi:MAG: hypothetical protein ACO31I_18935, partial [Prochlorotrichaceae cyanobacterium]
CGAPRGTLPPEVGSPARIEIVLSGTASNTMNRKALVIGSEPSHYPVLRLKIKNYKYKNFKL